MRRSFIAGALAWCLLQALPASAAGTASTIAGGGSSGYADGPAAAATFVLPMALAAVPNGDVVIPDMGANRIRLLHDRRVSTISGGGDERAPGNGWWMTGGYTDGPVAAARFNQPTAVAAAPDGTLYVSDAGNHCIRIIKDGTVGTYAGTCRTAGKADGPRATAGFAFPRQLALDARGDLYVADFGNGLRRISSEGVVSTIPLPQGSKPEMVVGVATWGSAPKETVFVSDHDGLVVINSDGTSKRYLNVAEGNLRLGAPDALVALGPREVAFTDARNHGVRLFWTNGPDAPSSDVLAGARVDDAAFNGGGYRDGDADGSLFFSPRGIALRANGEIVVSDTGNRRIRTIGGFDPRIPLLPGEIPSAGGNARDVYFLGSSYASLDRLWGDSTPGVLEQRLGGRVTAVRYQDGTPPGALEALALVARLPSRLIVWQVTTADRLAADTVARAVAIAASKKRKLLFVAVPTGEEAGPYEEVGAGAFVVPAPGAQPRAAFQKLVAALKAAHAGYLDLSRPVAAYEASASHLALFGTVDPHLTPEGNHFIGLQIAREAAGWMR